MNLPATAEQMQQFNNGLLLFGAAFLLFGAWFFRFYLPRVLEQRQEKLNAVEAERATIAQNEITRQRELFEEELAQRRQERQMEREQRRTETETNNQILQGYLESARNFVTLSGRMLDQSEKMSGEMHGHRTVLTNVSDTVDRINTEFAELKSQIEAIALSVQASSHVSTAVHNSNTTLATLIQQMMSSVEAFGHKLETIAQRVKEETGEVATILAETKPEMSP
jgi:hypothetical protein